MTYNFDEKIDRTHTLSVKYDFIREQGFPEDVLPLWVADMDFRAPTEVLDALAKTVEHGIYGYSDAKDDYFDTLHQWFSRRFGWNIHKPWLVKTPGVVNAICTAIRAFTEIGDAIIVQQPVYHPFMHSVLINERKLVNNPLVLKHGKYQINFEDFEEKILTNSDLR
ncbi:MAG: aminotransferase class I/II-fold pyridoxal phosphate-dependent enzyme [Eubacterium sp.]